MFTAYDNSFPGGSDRKESACNMGDLGLMHGWRRSLGEIKWLLTPVFLPGESHGQRNLVGYSPWGCRVKHDWVTNTFHFTLVTPSQRVLGFDVVTWASASPQETLQAWRARSALRLLLLLCGETAILVSDPDTHVLCQHPQNCGKFICSHTSR